MSLESKDKDSKSCPLKKTTLSSIIAFFEKNHSSQFGIRTLSQCFPETNIHSYLMELENSSVLIRSKICINEKPVTHWQLKAAQKSNSNNTQNKSLETQMKSNGHDKNDFPRNNSDNANGKSDGKVEVTKRCTSEIAINDGYFNEKGKMPPRRLIRQSRSVHSKEDDRPLQYTEPLNISDNSLNDAKSIEEKKNGLDSLDCKEKSNLNFLERRQISKKAFKSRPYLQGPGQNVKMERSTPSKEIMIAIERNPVSILHEFAQQKGINCQIEVVKMVGPSHKPTISMLVSLEGYKFDAILAPNKKEGKRLAAEVAIKKLISEGYFSPSISKILSDAALKKEGVVIQESIVPKKSVVMVDKIASLVCNELTILLRDLTFERRNLLAGRIVISGIVMEDEKLETLRVVALATGNRSISGDKINLQGKVLNDCHAEILTRRSFMLFLYQQLSAHLTSSEEYMSIFEDYQDSSSLSVLRRFKVKSHIKFHLYISTAPCGDSALFCNKEDDLKKFESELILSSKHKPTYDHPVQGLLRSKVEGGEGTIPIMISDKPCQTQTLTVILSGEPLKTMSCSDKIARWNYLGLQGSMLTQFLDPIFLASISLGSSFDAGHLSRAVCCRLDRDRPDKIGPCRAVNHPDLGFVHTGSLQKDGDKRNQFSVNWSHGLKLEIVDGDSGELIGPEKTIVCSRISKSSLFYQYLKLFRTAGYNPFVKRYSYLEAKLLSTDYERKKEKLFEIFHRLGYGSWIRKPLQQNDFKATLFN